jgi:FkbM family methyltransferase
MRNIQRYKAEKNVIEDLIEELNQDDVFYDVGANTGIYSLFAAQVCEEGEVISFEPYPPNVNILRKDILRNNIENISIYDIALSNTDGVVTFNQPKNEDVGYGSASIIPDESKDTMQIQSTTGDKLVSENEIPPPNILKIDVEGSEPLVIGGLEKMLKDSRCRLIYCEIHLPRDDDLRPSIADFDSSFGDINNKLQEYGFKVEILKQTQSDIHIKAFKKGK